MLYVNAKKQQFTLKLATDIGQEFPELLRRSDE